MGNFVHRDVIQLDVAPEKVREYIMTPERIADYFPGVIDFGTFKEGKSIWCSSATGVSLLELIEEDCTDWKLTMRVVNASKMATPYCADAIKARPFMSMVEDWEIEATDGGTQLTKTWRNVVKHKMKWLPMGLMIRLTAKGEHRKLVEGWNRAAI